MTNRHEGMKEGVTAVSEVGRTRLTQPWHAVTGPNMKSTMGNRQSAMGIVAKRIFALPCLGYLLFAVRYCF